jgi:hypothetical protein
MFTESYPNYLHLAAIYTETKMLYQAGDTRQGDQFNPKMRYHKDLSEMHQQRYHQNISDFRIELEQIRSLIGEASNWRQI